MVFVDRKAKYPGRWTMKKSDGTSEIVTLVRNDEPEVEGTPMNAETLNTLSDVAGADIARQQAEVARDAAAGSATEAASSASAAEESKTAAATSESNAAKHEESAKKYSDEAGAKAGTDKTLSIENAPADAKATGDALAKKVGKDVILDEDGNVIFYSKEETGTLVNTKLSGYYTQEQIATLLTAKKLADHPVGSSYQSTDPTSPAELFGGTWERIEDCTIWGASSIHPAGTKLGAGLPNITGSAYGDVQQSGASVYWSGSRAIQTSNDTGGNGICMYKVADYGNHRSILKFDASKSNSIYGKSATVQPPAYCMYLWHRVA